VSAGTPRRTVLLGALGAAAGGLALSACNSGRENEVPIPPTTTSTSIPAAPTPGMQVAALAASLENLAVYAYGEGLKATGQGKGTALAPAPPGLAGMVQTARDHHVQHAAKWNQLLTSAKLPPVTNTDPSLSTRVNAMLAGLSDPLGLAELALYLENTLAQTYQAVVGELGPDPFTQPAATTQAVEMQHAAGLYFVLGRYPGVQGGASNGYSEGEPLAVGPLGLARTVSDYQGE
jgi:Ferritin-like domain